MCITKTEAWGFDGKTYPTEGKAIAAAIAKKCNLGEAVAQGVIDHASDVIPLLQRIVEIEREKNANKAAPAKAQEGPAAEGPSLEQRRRGLIDELQALAQGGAVDRRMARRVITDAGFDNLQEVFAKASDVEIARMRKAAGFKPDRCDREELHEWKTDPKNSLIDVCLRCGEERA